MTLQTADPTGTGEPTDRFDLDVLVVGTFGGGRVHQYVDQQVERLSPHIDVRTHEMGMPSVEAGRTRVLQGLLLGLLAAARFLARDPPDLVHVHTSHRFSFYRASVYVFVANYLWGVPVVLHVHGSGFDDFLATDSQAVATLQRAVFRASDEIVVLSSYWKDLFLVRADEGKLRVLPNAVEPGAYPADIGAERPHVVFVSNLVERKGVAELVDAVERLLERRPGEVSVSIAGDGPLADSVERHAADHEEVAYLGYVSEERKRELLNWGSIYVLPTYAEGLPIAMLEGMAGGNAVVSTAVGSIPEVVDEDRGVLVATGDVDELVDALEELVAAPERRVRMAANNRAAVEEEYAWDRIVDELLTVYGTHASGSSGSASDEATV